MSKGFDIPSNTHLGNSHDYWKAPQKNSKQIVVQPLQWLPIDRDENGFATEECLDKMFSTLPIVVVFNLPDGRKVYEGISETGYIDDWRGDIDRDTHYTHYLPIPKLEE